MEYKTYIAGKRARFNAASGPVNIPYGTPLQVEGDFLCLNGKQLCFPTAQNSLDFFVQNDDGRGKERGELVNTILSRLQKPDKGKADRWKKVWGDSLCQKFKRPEHDDQWIWNFDFFNAQLEDLRYIAALIGA